MNIKYKAIIPVLAATALGNPQESNAGIKDGFSDIVGHVRDYARPVLTTAALGSLTYSLVQGENPLESNLGMASTAVVGYGAWKGFKAYSQCKFDPELSNYYRNIPSEDRLDMGFMGSYVDFLRSIDVEGADEVADDLQEITENGLFFGNEGNGHASVVTGMAEAKFFKPIDGFKFGLESNDLEGSGTGGAYSFSSGVLVLAYVGDWQEDYGIDVFKSNLKDIAHEGDHVNLSGRRWKTGINDFFGIPHDSSLNLVEEPARDFADKVLEAYDEREASNK